MTVRIGIATVACALALAASGYAQNRRWADPYQKGVKAFEDGKYQQAIGLLEQAVKAEPRAEANKLEEGVHRIDYFPYYYLGLAYAETGEFDKALQNLEKARSTLTRQQQARFSLADAKTKLALAPKPPPRNTAFDSGVRETETLLAGKQFGAAIKKIDQLRTIDAAEYGKAGLAGRREEAVKGLSAQLLGEARAAIQGARYKDALAKLHDAEELQPGQKPVTDLIAELARRDAEYQRIKGAAQADATAKNYESAKTKLQQAQGVQPELFASDNLAVRLTEYMKLAERARLETRGDGGAKPPDLVTTPPDPSRSLVDKARVLRSQGKYTEASGAYADALKANAGNRDAIAGVAQATTYQRLREQLKSLSTAGDRSAAQKVLLEARNVDAARSERDGLAGMIGPPAALSKVAEAMPGTRDDPAELALKNGLLALLKGDAQGSIAILEPAASRGNAASLHAYLGVAYATRALSAPNPDERGRLQDRAVQEFKLAQAVEPAYALSSRVVSPAIVAIYQGARR